MISLSEHCPLLEVLELGWNNLSSSDSGVLGIQDYIKHMKKLQELGLDFNPFHALVHVGKRKVTGNITKI